MPRRFIPESPIYAFRVRLPGGVDPEGSRHEEVWRVIEVAANQTGQPRRRSG